MGPNIHKHRCASFSLLCFLAAAGSVPLRCVAVICVPCLPSSRSASRAVSQAWLPVPAAGAAAGCATRERTTGRGGRATTVARGGRGSSDAKWTVGGRACGDPAEGVAGSCQITREHGRDIFAVPMRAHECGCSHAPASVVMSRQRDGGGGKEALTLPLRV